jgi:hypothetical protein
MIDRIDFIAKRILAMCVASSELGIGGLDYLNGKQELSHYVLKIVHGIKERLELELKVDLNGIEFSNPCDLEGEEKIEETDEDGNEDIDNIKRNRINNKVGSSIMMEAFACGYKRIRTALKADKKLIYHQYTN